MIRLEPMKAAEFDSLIEQSIAEYAEEQARSGNWTREEAPDKAAQSFKGLLPNGLDTDGQHVLRIANSDGQTVGTLWYMERQGSAVPSVFICELRILEPFRRRGYATAAMRALEKHTRREHDAQRIVLHTFAHNQAARKLYTSLAYRETNVTMAKDLD